MTKHNITLIDVRNYIDTHDIINYNPENVTLFEGIAKSITLGLTGKNVKQDRERIKGFMTTIWGQRNGAASDQDEGGVDDFRTESDEAQAALNDAAMGFDGDAEPDLLEDSPAPEPEADEDQGGDEASNEAEGDEDGEKVDRSVVKAKYRTEYKARGDARICGDWLSLMLKGLANGPKRKLDLDCFVHICELNDSGPVIQRYITADKRLTNGWQGRARMSGRLAMEQVVARNSYIQLPTKLWDACSKKVDELLEKAGIEQPKVEVEDDMVFVTCPRSWAQAILAKRPNADKKEKAKTSTEAEAA